MVTVSTASLDRVNVSTGPRLPLDLVDVRKTQRRLKALLGGITDVQRNAIRRRPIPRGFCYVCNGIDELGKYKNPHTHLFSKGFFKHCEHQPKTPYPTVVDEYDSFDFTDEYSYDNRRGTPETSGTYLNRENSDTNLKFNFKVSVKKKTPDEDYEDKYSKKYFNTSVLRRSKYEDMGFDDESIYKLPSVFDSGYNSNTTDRDSGKLVPRVSERTFEDAGRYEDKQSEHEADTQASAKTDDSLNLPPLVKRRKSKQDSVSTESQKTKSETPITRNDELEVSNESMSVSDAESLKSVSASSQVIKEVSKENLTEGSMIIQRVSTSPHWCTCAEPDFSKTKCQDCKQINGHEKWCLHSKSPTKQPVCVHCGKPIRVLPERSLTSPERRLSRSTSNHECESRHASPIKKTPDIRHRSPIKHKKEKENRVVHFQDEPAVKEIRKAPIEPLTRDPTDEDFLDINDVIYDESGKMWVPTEEFDRDFDKNDPNIHRNAYLKALKEVRSQKLKKIVEIDEKFIRDRLTRPFVFSYFKLLPAQKNALPDGPRDIGIKPDVTKNVLPRNAMKHIFGKVNVSDYYPGGKKNPDQVTLSLQEEKHRQTMPIHKLKWKNK